MKVKYQITMEVEVESHSTTTKEDLASYAKSGFIGRAYMRDRAKVNKVEVLRVGVTGVTPKVISKKQPPYTGKTQQWPKHC